MPPKTEKLESVLTLLDETSNHLNKVYGHAYAAGFFYACTKFLIQHATTKAIEEIEKILKFKNIV